MASFPNPFAANDSLTAAKLNDVANTIYDAVSPGAIGIFRASLLPAEAKVVTGSPLAYETDSYTPKGANWYQYPAALNDELSWGAMLSADTYTLNAWIRRYGNYSGIVTFYIDGLAVGTCDFYAGTPTGRIQISFPNIQISTSGWKQISAKVTGKSAFAVGYQAHYYHLWLVGSNA